MPSVAIVSTRPSAAHPRDLARFLTATGVAVWGAGIGRIAVPVLAVDSLAAGAGQAGLLTASATAPFLLLGLPVGAWLDRVRRRPVMIAADLARFVLLAAIPILHALGALSIEVLVTLMFGVGVATVFFDLASQSHLPDLVDPAAERGLVAANGRLATIAQSSVVGAPAVAGWLTGMIGPATVVIITSCGYLWSACWLRQIARPEPAPEQVRRAPVATEIGEGWRFVAGNAELRAVTLAGALVNIASSGMVAMLPIVFLRELGWTSADLGLFLGVGGVGGLLGATTATRLADRLGVGPAMLAIGVAVAPAALLVPAVGSPVPGSVAAAAWGCVLFKVGFDGVMMMSLRQHATPRHLLGRVNGMMRVVFSGALTVGAGTAALLGNLIDPRAAMWACCAALAMVWIPIALSPIRHIRSIDEPSHR